MFTRTRAVALSLLVCMAATAWAAEENSKTGRIKSVDAQARTFVVMLPARPLTFKVDDKTAITLDGKASTFEDAIAADRMATVTYGRSGEDRLASKVEVKTMAAR